MATALHDHSIAELSGLIAARKLSPVELVEALIERIEGYDGQTRAFITRTFDLARRQAKQAEAEIEAGRYRGALHGVPFALKDVYDTAGILTSGHSRVFIDRVPREAPRRPASSTRPAPCSSGSWPPTRWPTLAPRSISRGPRLATRGTSRTSPVAPRRDRGPRWLPAWSRWRSALTPGDRSGAPLPSAVWSASCRRSGW